MAKAKFIFKDTNEEIKVGDTFFVIETESYHINGGGRQYKDLVRTYIAHTVGAKWLNKSKHSGYYIDEYNTTDYNSIFASKESCELIIKMNLLKKEIYHYCNNFCKIKDLSNDDILAIAKILKITHKENN